MPLRVLAATGEDEYRKPRIGMLDVVEQVYRDRGVVIGPFITRGSFPNDRLIDYDHL